MDSIIGDIELANPPTSEPPIKDSLDLARHVWRKGRHEAMGGPTVYTQGHGAPGYVNNNRKMGFPPAALDRDPMIVNLQTDVQE